MAVFSIAPVSHTNKASFKVLTCQRSNVNFEVKGYCFRIDQKIYQQDKNVRLQIGCNAPKRLRKDMDIKCEMESSANDRFVTEKPINPVTAVPPVEGDSYVGKDNGSSEVRFQPDLDNGIGSGGSFDDGTNGKFPPGGGGGGEGGSGDDGHDEGVDPEAAEFGPILEFEEIMRETKARAIQLPSDMLEAAKSVGIRKVFLENYMNLQGSGLLGFGIRSCSLFRNRMLVDRHFLFKIGTEIVIDSCCATFAEVQKRGKDFWSEFELYAADLLVGIVVDIALVTMLAPYARIGKPSTSNGLFGRMGRAYSALPSSVFEAERPGCRFSVQQRIATYFYKGLMYGAVGFGCGLLGQGIANLIMTAKRSVDTSDENVAVPVPPLFKSAALWGVFLGYSSNTRYQIVNGLERVVEASPMSKRLPSIAMAFTVGVRFSNNIYGGMQFVDWARWSGCQ